MCVVYKGSSHAILVSKGLPCAILVSKGFPHAILVSKKNAEYLLNFPGTSVFTLFAKKLKN